MPPKNVSRVPAVKRPCTTVSLFRKKSSKVRGARTSRRTYRRSYRRSNRSYKRKPMTARLTRMFDPAKSFFPDRYKTKMSFVSGIFKCSLNTTVQWLAFGSTGIFQPQLTQPTGTTYAPANTNITACTDSVLGHTQLSAIYQNYRVNAVSIRFEGQVGPGAGGDASESIYILVGSSPINANAVSPSTTDLRSFLQSREYTHYLRNGEHPIHMKKYFTGASILGQTKVQFIGNDAVQAAVTQNPASNPPIWIGFATMDLVGAGADQTNIWSRFYLTYYVEYFGPREVAAVTPKLNDPIEVSSVSSDSTVSLSELTKSDFQVLKKLKAQK